MHIKKRGKIIIIIMIIITISALIVWQYINKPNIDYSELKPDVTLSYTALLKEANTNDTATFKKYSHTLIAVTGFVKEIKNDSLGFVVQIGDTTSLSSIVCQMDNRYNKDCSTIKKGQLINLKGKITGCSNDELLGTTVEMNFCVLQK
jgi:hypothetical protein